MNNPAIFDARTIARLMGGVVNGDCALVPGPGHSPKDHSLSIKPDSAAPDGFIVHSFANDDFLECRDYVKAKLGITPEPRRPNRNGAAKSHIVKTYPYVDAIGELQFEVCRYEPKDFRQRRPDGKGGWIWNLQGVLPGIPYRLPELMETIASEYVVIVAEGEKDVDALRDEKIGLDATCNAGGAGKWRDEHSRHLRGAHVVIICDNDDPGRDHAAQVAISLQTVAKSVCILDLAAHWPECPPKGDISDSRRGEHANNSMR
jgi:5S rRNA maturation endonuclease (ribonuclease M5)